MKKYLSGIATLVFVFGILLQSQAQTEEESILVTVETLKTDDEKSKEERKKNTAVHQIKDFYRHHKKLPKTFEGYAIELTTSDFPLARDYHLFEQFGEVFYERRKGQGYAYLIMINFSSKKAIESYIKNIIIHKAPEAHLVEYKKGKRTKK